jgi:biotin operon repressor
MKATDEQLIGAWKIARSYAEVGRELSISRQTAHARITSLRAKGIDLLPALPAGYILTSERAKEIGKLRGAKDDGKRG